MAESQMLGGPSPRSLAASWFGRVCLFLALTCGPAQADPPSEMFCGTGPFGSGAGYAPDDERGRITASVCPAPNGRQRRAVHKAFCDRALQHSRPVTEGLLELGGHLSSMSAQATGLAPQRTAPPDGPWQNPRPNRTLTLC